MNAEEAVLLQLALSAGLERIPDSKVAVEPRAEGAAISATVDGTVHRFVIGDGDSAILRVLLGGTIL